MKRLLAFLFLFLILLVSPVFAIKPGDATQSGTPFAEGYVIEYPTYPFIKVDEPFEFDFHVYNISNGLSIVKGISCDLHVFNNSGQHTFIDSTMIVEHNFNYDFYVTADNFTTQGEHQFVITCNNSLLGGYASESFIVNSTGDDHESSYFLLLIILIPIFICLLLFKISFVLDPEEHNVMKVGLMLLSLSFIFVIFWFAHLIIVFQFPHFTELIDALAYLTLLFGIVDFVIISYFIIYFVYKIFHLFAQKDKDDYEIEY